MQLLEQCFVRPLKKKGSCTCQSLPKVLQDGFPSGIGFSLSHPPQAYQIYERAFLFKFLKHSEKKIFFKIRIGSATRGTSNFHGFTQKNATNAVLLFGFILKILARSFLLYTGCPNKHGSLETTCISSLISDN